MRRAALACTCGCVLLLSGSGLGEQPASAPAGATCAPSGGTSGAGAGPDLEGLVTRLGDEDYRVREDATRQLLRSGPEIIPALETRLQEVVDPEVLYRLRFVLENVRPPQSALLVIRPDYESGGGLYAGDVITHVNNRRVHSRAELLRRLSEFHGGAMLRVRRATGPFETLLKTGGDLPVVCDYRAPQGEVIAQALRLYDYGYAEQAYELLRGLDGAAPESELPALLYAIIAYTAGDSKTAFTILGEHPDAHVPAAASSWTSPSALELAGPIAAPYHLELRLWTEAALADGGADRDVPIQRVLIPARRYADALAGVASMWWGENRAELGKDRDHDRVGGNLLAVSAWMMSELDLVSESMRLIEPRSAILRHAPQGVRKWIRVRTDAWLAFARGEARAALDKFYEDARAILQPPGPPAERAHIQNPQVAAQLAFFLYQFPTDERVAEMLPVVNQAGYRPLSYYARWMLYALRAENFEVVREHMLAMLPNARDSEAGAFALAAALLEYVRQQPDPEVIAEARARLADAPAWSEKQATAALISALERLAAGDAGEAGKALSAAGEQPGVSVLRSTAEFLAAIAATPPLDAGLQRPILAVRAGADGGSWLVLTRARQFVRCDLASGESTRVTAPVANWFPGPLNWPWVGREESSGRLWVYGLRRVMELSAPDAAGLCLNIRTEDIAAFDRYVRRSFSALADLAGGQAPAGETGELWREDLQAGQEYFADPDLAEVGFIRPLPPEQRMVQVALRGGAHLLIDAVTGRTWSSNWVAEQLGVEPPPRFLAQAAGQMWEEGGGAPGSVGESAEQKGPVLYLFSDAGLLRLDTAQGEVRRIELPGPEPRAAVIPEYCPYERRDPCWVYLARLPEAGGQVYRLGMGDDRPELLDMVNEALPREYYLMQSRAELRRRVDDLLGQGGVPSLREFVKDTEHLLSKYPEVNRP